MRRTYRYDEANDMFYEVGGNANFYEEEKPRGPAVIGDTLPGGINGIKNMADGRTYDSKGRYYKAVRAAGCEILGNENPSASKRELIGKREIGETIKRAMEETRQFGGDTSKRARILNNVGSGE
jgi:hypothetical protein